MLAEGDRVERRTNRVERPITVCRGPRFGVIAQGFAELPIASKLLLRDCALTLETPGYDSVFI